MWCDVSQCSSDAVCSTGKSSMITETPYLIQLVNVVSVNGFFICCERVLL